MPASGTTYFRSNALLERLPDEAIERLAAASRPVRLRRRATLWDEGDAADRVFWIRSGVVKIGAPSGPDPDHRLTLELHGRGAIVGEAAAVSGAPRSTRAEAHDECALFATPAAELAHLLDRHADLGRRLSALVCLRRERLQARLGTLLYRSSQARLAALLLELAADFGVRDSRGVIVNLKLTHRELAGLIGSSRETVSMALVDLRRAGLVQAENKRVVLLDEGGLVALGRPAQRRVDRG